MLCTLLHHETERVPLGDHVGIAADVARPVLVAAGALREHLVGSRHRPPVAAAGIEVGLPGQGHRGADAAWRDRGMVDAERLAVERRLDDGAVAGAQAARLDARKEGAADAGLERRAVHAGGRHRGLRCRHAGPVVREVDVVLPALHVRVLDGRERRVRVVQLRHVAARTQLVEDCGAHRRRGHRVDPGMRIGFIHPLDVACALQDGINVFGVRTAGGRRGQARVHHGLEHAVVQRGRAVLVRRELGRCTDDPGAHHCRRGIGGADLDGGGDGAVGDVVVPAGIAPEVDDAVAGRRGRRAGTAQHQQMVLRHRCASRPAARS